MNPTRHAVEPAPTVASIERDYATLARISAKIIRVADEENRLRNALSEAEASLEDLENRLDAARLALKLSILKAAPREIPPSNQWLRLAVAPWQVMSGNRVFALVPAQDTDIPTKTDELPEALTLAVIDLDPC